MDERDNSLIVHYRDLQALVENPTNVEAIFLDAIATRFKSIENYMEIYKRAVQEKATETIKTTSIYLTQSRDEFKLYLESTSKTNDGFHCPVFRISKLIESIDYLLNQQDLKNKAESQ